MNGATTARLKAIAQELLQKTRKGHVTWSRTDNPDRFLYSTNDVTVAISRSPGMGIVGISLRVYDEEGAETAKLDPATGFDAMPLLNDLFEAASGEGRATEQTLTALERALKDLP